MTSQRWQSPVLGRACILNCNGAAGGEGKWKGRGSYWITILMFNYQGFIVVWIILNEIIVYTICFLMGNHQMTSPAQGARAGREEVSDFYWLKPIHVPSCALCVTGPRYLFRTTRSPGRHRPWLAPPVADISLRRAWNTNAPSTRACRYKT